MAARTHSQSSFPNGAVAAAILAGAVGAATQGIVTTLAAASASISKSLTWSSPVGTLPGKVGITVIVYLLAWLGFGLTWKEKNLNFTRVAAVAFALLLIGILGTFPPVFDLIAGK